MNEFQTFLNAVQFYTRIPLGKIVKYTPKRQENSIRYFPIIGIIVGAVLAAVIVGLKDYFGLEISILLGVTASVFITGALHEDGLADCCDGFGGGWTKEKVLKIMKDSSIGAYGAIGLILFLLLKIAFLIKLLIVIRDVEMVFLFLIAAQVLSRASGASMMLFLDYARTDDSSKSSEVAKRLSVLNAIAIFGTGILATYAVVWFYSDVQIWIVLPVLGVLVFAMARYFKKRIGGYTGDCLGMLQQLSELTIYGTFAALWS